VALQVYGDANPELSAAILFLLGSSQVSRRNSNAAVYLAAITTVLAAAGSTIQDLMDKNADPSVWLFLSQLGIARACGLDIEAASDEAERVVPEMSAQMADYRAGAEMVRRLKGARSE
jgi:hypothetical protein